MHTLARQVRFSINPFLAEVSEGFNSYASKPCGEGLALYFGLWVELAGPVDTDTGFVVNVTEIDRQVRKFIVPIFAEHIGNSFRRAQHISLFALCEILIRAWAALDNKFDTVSLHKLCLELNPFRKIAIESEDCEMIYFSENPTGDGHNYVIEVTVKAAVEDGDFCIGKFEKIVDDEFIQLVDHKNLNVDVAEFDGRNPTVENIAAFAWEKLTGKFRKTGDCLLFSVTVWETDRMYCTYRSQEAKMRSSPS